MNKEPVNIESLCDALGRTKIATACGLADQTAVSRAIREGKFPARWFAPIKGLAVLANVPCPVELFAFAGAAE